MKDQELKLKLAKMLPEKIEVIEHTFTSGVVHTVCIWWRSDENTTSRHVLETEWLHVCWLAEKTLEEKDYKIYTDNLVQPAVDFDNNYGCLSDMDYRRCVVSASWQQRAKALCKVKGI